MTRPVGGSGRPADPPPVDAWALACALSPQPIVRVAEVDADGVITNRYPDTTATSGPPPALGLPYAVHLTDSAGRYRLLGFDLDAKAGPVDADLGRLRALLTQARLAHMVCASGPGGGRHVWVGLTEAINPERIAGLARGLALLLPSLDIAPLTNRRTGALRPPLAPHRLGGRSEILDGQLSDVLRPTATVAQVLTLAGLVDAAHTVDEPPASTLATPRDEHGHRHLTGARRALSTRAAAALYNPLPASANFSEVLATALCGAVRARWHLTDILEVLATAPGLEHARTERRGRTRHPRSTVEQVRVLTRQWHRTVAFAAANPTHAGDDPTFEPRCAAIVDAIAAAQRRADASPGRWARPGGPADRRVLDVACAQMLAAISCDIELDTRRLALIAGIGRDTARVALQRLARDGWIASTTPAAGIHGAHWALPQPPATLSTSHTSTSQSQGAPRPSDPRPRRAAWRSHLAQRISSLTHDALTAHGLGHHTARTFQVLSTSHTAVADITARTGYSYHRVLRQLDRLATHRLVVVDGAGRWRLPMRDHRTSAARTLGVHGVLVDRAARYKIERDAWEWWTEELAWRKLAPARRKRAPGAGQLVITLTGHVSTHTRWRGPHPRTSVGRADFAAARRYLSTGPDLPQTG